MYFLFMKYAILFFVLILVSCSSFRRIPASAEPIPTAFGALKTGAYAVVQSPKNEQEVYVARNTRSFAADGQEQRLELVPQDFSNAYSDVVISVRMEKGQGIAMTRLEFQGEGFADRYIAEIGFKDAEWSCDGQTGRLKWKGQARSTLNGSVQDLAVELLFELGENWKSVCTAR